MSTNLLFFPKRDSVQTDPEFYKQLDAVFHFDFDPCPHTQPPWNGLEVDWGTSNFVNPPFSQIGKWLEKAVKEMEKGKLSVVLVPCRPNTRYWQQWVFPWVSTFHFLDKIGFVGFTRPIPIPMVLLVYDPAHTPHPFEETVVGGVKAWKIR